MHEMHQNASCPPTKITKYCSQPFQISPMERENPSPEFTFLAAFGPPTFQNVDTPWRNSTIINETV